MKKRNLLKNVLCLLLISSMALTLFSCGKNEAKQTEKSAETEFPTENDTTRNTVIYMENETEVTNHIKYNKIKDYQIIQVEDGYRLVFDDSSFYAKYESPQIVGFTIDSWEDFSNRLLEGTLTLDEKTSIYYTFAKDEDGIAILNPYISYNISHSLPHQSNYDGTYTGAYYVPYITCDEKYTMPVGVTILSKDLYNRDYEACFLDIDTKEKNIEYKKNLPNNDIMTCYNKATETKGYNVYEKYILANDEKTVFISKAYDDFDAELPYDIYVLVKLKNEIYFEMNFSREDITKDLTDEFLFGFDVEAVERT